MFLGLNTDPASVDLNYVIRDLRFASFLLHDLWRQSSESINQWSIVLTLELLESFACCIDCSRAWHSQQEISLACIMAINRVASLIFAYLESRHYHSSKD